MRIGRNGRFCIMMAICGVTFAAALASAVIVVTAGTDIDLFALLFVRALAGATCLCFASAGVAWVFSEHHWDEDRKP